MKKAFLFVAVAAFSFALPSCKKCSTCEFKYDDGSGTSVSQTYPEACGKKKDIDAYEDACKTAAAVWGASCNCSKS